MLDVHPPHAPTHTWRDFFIHIATIVVGLLIAVGLEQTVEFFHHRHQRHELEANLRVDGELNHEWANQDLDAVTTLRDWAQSQAVVVEHGSSSGPLTVPAVALGHITTPNFGVFLAARANGQMSLLSNWQQDMQADLDRGVNQIFISDWSDYRRLKSTLGELNQLLLGHATPHTGGSLDISSLNAAQRVELAQRLSAVAESARQMQGALVHYAAGNELLLDNPEAPAEGEFDKQFQRLVSRIAAAHQDTNYSFTLR